MTMRLAAAVAALAGAGAAHAAFVGGVIRVDEAASAAATAANGGNALTVTRMFMRFDEADDILNRIGNSDVSTVNGATLFQETLFGNPVNTSAQQNSGAWGAIPTLEFDSYVGIGGPDDNFGTGSDTLDPDFSFTSTGWTGGWFDVPGMDGSRQGVAGDGQFNDGLWEVFAGQFTLVGDFTGGARGGAGPQPPVIVFSDLFEGVIDIGWIDQAGGPEIPVFGRIAPAPGAASLFGVAGLAAARRRR